METLFDTDGRAVLIADAIDGVSLADLIDQLDWVEEDILIFGKRRKVPRLIAYYGEFPYTYSGTTHEARSMPNVLQKLCDLVEKQTGHSFNSVLCNRYRDGNDSMGWHRDNEPEMNSACIASLSFGAERKFKFRNRNTKQTIDIILPNSSLLLMLDCQDVWEHSLPKTKQNIGERVNLTLRQMKVSR